MFTSEDLRSRFIQTEEYVARLTEGTDSVRAAVASTKSVLYYFSEFVFSMISPVFWTMLKRAHGGPKTFWIR